MSLPSPLRRLLGPSRRADRESKDLEAHLFEGVIPLAPVTLIDRSCTGARVQLHEPISAARMQHLLLIDSSELIDVEVVWTSADQVGLRLGPSRRLIGYAGGEHEAIKTWWSSRRVLASQG